MLLFKSVSLVFLSVCDHRGTAPASKVSTSFGLFLLAKQPRGIWLEAVRNFSQNRVILWQELDESPAELMIWTLNLWLVQRPHSTNTVVHYLSSVRGSQSHEVGYQLTAKVRANLLMPHWTAVCSHEETLHRLLFSHMELKVISSSWDNL